MSWTWGGAGFSFGFFLGVCFWLAAKGVFAILFTNTELAISVSPNEYLGILFLMTVISLLFAIESGFKGGDAFVHPFVDGLVYGFTTFFGVKAALHYFLLNKIPPANSIFI